MADKQWCPACDSLTSTLKRAYDEYEPCPSCGLTNEAWREVLQVRQARDDDAMAVRFTELRTANDKLQREQAELHLKINQMKSAVERLRF